MILTAECFLTNVTLVRPFIRMCPFVYHQVVRFGEVTEAKSEFDGLVLNYACDEQKYLQMYSFFGLDFFFILSFVADSANLWKLNLGSSDGRPSGDDADDVDACWLLIGACGISNVDELAAEAASFVMADTEGNRWWKWWWCESDHVGDSKPNCFRHREATSIEFCAEWRSCRLSISSSAISPCIWSISISLSSGVLFFVV